MKSKIMRLTFLAVASFAATMAWAQVEFSGEAGSYRLVNFRPVLAGKVVSDVTTKEPKTRAKMVLRPIDMSDNSQVWIFTRDATGDATSFYLRNAGTRNYLSNAVNIFVRAGRTYNLLTGNTVKTNVKSWQIIPLGDYQYAISSDDEFGVRRYLNIGDTLSTPPSLARVTALKNSSFAWYIYPSDIDPTGVADVTVESRPEVAVVDGHIIVAGVAHYDIYDLQGRNMPRETRLPKGTYIVRAGGRGYKVNIK